LLSLLSNLSKPKKILEVGTFTGYSSICLSEGLICNSNTENNNNVEKLLTDEKMTDSKDLEHNANQNPIYQLLNRYERHNNNNGILISIDKDMTSLRIAEKYINMAELDNKVRDVIAHTGY
jgi:predicted O-methyltransferase YrrM